jgi:hypothetical protein
MAKPASINLLSKKQSTSDVVLGWALTTGRFIIIVTETIALAAFAYRFTLDRQIIDLHDQIKQKQAIVEFYKKDETKFRLLQSKLTTLASLDAKSTEVVPFTEEIVKLANGRAVLDALTIQPGFIKLTAKTTKISLMNSFVNSIKAYPQVLGVAVTQVENKPDTGEITLTMEITLKPKKG